MDSAGLQNYYHGLGVIAILSFIQSSDGAITGWTSPTPAITGATGGNIEMGTAVAENSIAVGATIFTATATGDGASRTYALISSTDSVGTIDTSSGVVSVATGKTLDYETATKYIFEVEATDGGAGGSGSGTATITLTITDVNEAPSFASSLYAVCIDDAAAAATTLTTLTGTDPDSGATLSYSITGGDTNTDFSAPTSAGIITTAKVMNSTATPGYSLTYEVSDSSLTGSTTLVVYVGSCTCESNNGAIAVGVMIPILILSLFAAKCL